METKNEKYSYENLKAVARFLESSVYPSLARTLRDANAADAISYNREFRKIFMNKFAKDLWRNNPLHPERGHECFCDGRRFDTVVGEPRPPPDDTFPWGMTRERAAVIIQV